MTFTLEQFEFYLVILARISAFVYAAPFFSMSTVPQRIKIGLSAVLAYLVFTISAYQLSSTAVPSGICFWLRRM